MSATLPRRKRSSLALALLGAFFAVSTLTACNTMEGAGQDMKAAGSAVEKSADKNKAY